ncbi:MAG: OmpH family outer membrane protein [Cyclobacteriaceae bacterium]|nr:OmpH family outer membrane protein [Cyclobacteriaceae bacterium]
MNKLKYFVVMVVIFVSSAAMAQTTQKIGHMDMQYVLSVMPEMKRVQSELQTLQSQLEKQAAAKQKEFEEKYNRYVNEGPTMAEAVRMDLEKDLTDMQQNAQNFAANAQKSLQKKENELMQPVYEKIGNAINDVAKEGGYSYIINAGVPGLDVLYYADTTMDVSNAVLKKMGIEPPAAN